MKIDKSNYEAFFLDFVEGRLDDSSTLELLNFLHRHPELKEELESFSDVKLAPAEVSYNEKNSLKKFDFSTSVNQKNFDDYSIAYYEKLLTPAESEKLLTFLQLNPNRNVDFLNYGKTYLKADEQLVFEAKPFLKKKLKGIVASMVLRWTAVAAGIVIAISVFYHSPEEPKVTVTSKTSVAVSTKTENSRSKDNNVVFRAPLLPAKKKTVVASKNQNSSVLEETIAEQPKSDASAEELHYIQPVQMAALKNNDGILHPELMVREEIVQPVLANNENDDTELLDYAAQMIQDKVLKNKEKKKISIWDLAELTVKGYNKISEKDITFSRQTDESGKLTAIAIQTENRKYGFETKN